MATYDIEFTRAARKSLRALPRESQKRIDVRILALAQDPRPPGVEKLRGLDSTYRIRVGSLRILYRVDDEVLVVLVIRIGHRRDVYRQLL